MLDAADSGFDSRAAHALIFMARLVCKPEGTGLLLKRAPLSQGSAVATFHPSAIYR